MISNLFDAGTTDLFSENTSKLNVIIEGIDCLIISHDLYDHGSKISIFLTDI